LRLTALNVDSTLLREFATAFRHNRVPPDIKPSSKSGCIGED
jgi:hypothetical protein